MSNYRDSPHIVVGAGLCGLATCLELERQGHSCLLVEASSDIGGVIGTEIFEGGYLLDTGFQVLLPAYSELLRNVDFKELDLKSFHSGAIVCVGQKKFKIADPIKNPLLMGQTLFSKVGSFKDKLLVVKLLGSVWGASDEAMFESSLGSCLDYLKAFGFSSDMIDHFWAPFFGGIFLETDLKTEASFFRFLFKMFSRTPVAVPAKGMGQLPQALFAKLKKTELRLNTQVTDVTADHVTLVGHPSLTGRVIDTRPVPAKSWGSVTTLYFAAEESPIDGPWLVLNSLKNGRIVNHVAVMSEVSKDYAPRGDALISVNVILPALTAEGFERVKRELVEMFGDDAKAWRFLKSFEISRALPLYLSVPDGDRRFETPSQQGAFLRAKNLVSRATSLTPT